MAFDRFWRTVLFTMPFVVKLLVCMGVTDFLWPILWRVVWISSASWTLQNGPPLLLLAADPITIFIMFDTVYTPPFVSLVLLIFW